ncbi:hypothetical protein D3C86_2119900 [compost metagenome]
MMLKVKSTLSEIAFGSASGKACCNRPTALLEIGTKVFATITRPSSPALIVLEKNFM